MSDSISYPPKAVERSRWVRSLRGEKHDIDPQRPYAYLWEEESDRQGSSISVSTLFLTNREGPYTCLMCDLWKNTLDQTAEPGAIPEQIRFALSQLPAAKQIKLYNAGSFFDPSAIPEADYEEIAKLLKGFERVIVECHPKFLGDRAIRFQGLISGKLEVAIGLETAHEPTLALLNKGITLNDFVEATEFLRIHEMLLRVVILLRPPFQDEAMGIDQALHSVKIATDCGAETCCIIPTRGGNGALERLALSGDFTPPKIRSLEYVLQESLRMYSIRTFADTWDLEKFYDCECSSRRSARIREMNRTQMVQLPIHCDECSP